MKILILGTSNSILGDGWVKGLRDALPAAEITNLSAGASPGTQFGCHLGDDLSRYDFVFFDSVVNDENLLGAIGTRQFSDRLTYEIISSLAAKTNLVVMGFSNERHLHEHSDVYQTRRQLAEICGGQFIGIHQFIRKFGTQILPGCDSLFDSAGVHPASELQQFFGYEIGRALVSPTTVIPFHRQNRDFSSHFKVEGVETLASPKNIFIKSNSLAKSSFLELGPDTSLAFASDGLCIGFYICSRSTRSLVLLQGPDEVRGKELWYNLQPHGFEKKFVPVRNGFPMQRMVIASTNFDGHDKALIERSPHSSFDPHAPTLEAKLTFSCALFWNGNPDDPIPAANRNSGQELALHHQIDLAISSQLALAGRMERMYPVGS